MKASLAALLLPAAANARFVTENEINRVITFPTGAIGAEESTQGEYLVELAPGETKWVTEEEKWELRRNGQRFMDITNFPDLHSNPRSAGIASSRQPIFPGEMKQQDEVTPLLDQLKKQNMQEHLEKFTSFYTRYYKSDHGRQSSEWLFEQVKETIKNSGAHKHGVTVRSFQHSWGQNSIIATIPGQSNSTVVIGAHQDSINLILPSVFAAPGADDDGSGTVTILEAFRVLLESSAVAEGKAANTIEFHWYSAEEAGLLGSQAIFSQYKQDGREIKAMLQQDMTGYSQGTLDKGKPESVGVITDHVDPGLTAFIKKVIEAYCTIPWVETKCGYACSDHASASKAGYPSSFVIESEFSDSDQHIHTTDDITSYLSFDHMLQHARMTLGLVYELGFTDFAKLEGKADGAMDEL